MDISNIYLKKRKCFEIFAHKAELMMNICGYFMEVM